MPSLAEGQTRRPEAEGMKAYTILTMRVAGQDHETIAATVGVTVQTVKQVIKAAADDARRQARDIVNEQFMLALRRQEALYALCQKQLDDYAANKPTALPWKDILDTMKVMIQLMIRQSDLLGLDANKTKTANQGKSGVNDWLHDPNVSPQKVAEEAARYGIRVPERFAVEGFQWSVPLSSSQSS
jgi:hypothetical protein